ncbi:hypothetical protein F7725_008253 [Dissostichus mawsoni]|uniref:Uncharacterized protein n=1 Tax=Dissostichus mawsoni TaxID=36200 RepID=A0A7J5Y6S3_DISMA|nr:hypothetical protein F7725_008253 [Dissostichus mawsoni]
MNPVPLLTCLEKSPPPVQLLTCLDHLMSQHISFPFLEADPDPGEPPATLTNPEHLSSDQWFFCSLGLCVSRSHSSLAKSHRKKKKNCKKESENKNRDRHT